MDNGNGAYKQFFEGIPCYVTVQSRELQLVAANSLFRKDFGNGVGSYCYEVYKGRTDKCPVCPVEKTFADGRIHRSEEIIRRRNGEEVVVIVFSAPIRDEQGNIIAAVEASTGFTPYRPKREQVPAELQPVLNTCRSIYERLYARRLRSD